MMRNLDLQRAGYPLRANDLTLDEWLDLGRIGQALPDPQPVILYKPKK